MTETLTDKEFDRREAAAPDDDFTLSGELSELSYDDVFTNIPELKGKTVGEVMNAISNQTTEGYQFKDILENKFDKDGTILDCVQKVKEVIAN